jgi:hypothetical protein
MPKVIASSSTTRPLGQAYNLQTTPPGVPLAAVSDLLSEEKKASINEHLGLIFSTFSGLPAPTSQFGLLARPMATTWRSAFGSLLEAVLRDAEDMVVLLPYETIRAQAARYVPLLDAVTSPRLVPLSATDPQNVLVDVETARVVGFRDLSLAVWGDLLFAPVFGELYAAEGEGVKVSIKREESEEGPDLEEVDGEESEVESDDFETGFGACPARKGNERSRQLLCVSPLLGYPIYLDDWPPPFFFLCIKILNFTYYRYIVYHSLVTIVRHYYRPSPPLSGRRELDARKRLTSALMEMRGKE